MMEQNNHIEARRLAEQEQANLDRVARHPDRRVAALPLKVTVVDIDCRREERVRNIRAAEEARKQLSRTSDEEYEPVVLLANTNRDFTIIEARSIEEAIAKIAVSSDSVPRDDHPERQVGAPPMDSR